MSMPRLLFLNDTRDHDNWGANAGADALFEIFKEKIPGLTVDSIMSSWTTRRFRKLPGWLGGEIYWARKKYLDRFSLPFEFLPVVADDFENAAEDWLNGKGGPFADELLTKLKNADVIVFNAEGSTYRNNTSSIRCLFALWLAKTHFNIPALFMNGSVTLTPVDPILPAMFRKALSPTLRIAVREPISLRNVEEFAPGISAELVPDSVFHFSSSLVDKADEKFHQFKSRLGNKPYFCFSLSMLLSMVRGYLRHGVTKSSLFALITRLKKIVPQSVILARDGMDQVICQQLADSTGSLLFGPSHSYANLMSLLQNARFLISGRYHHLIISIIAGCPSIALKTTSHKVDGLCELMEGEIGTAIDATEMWNHIDSIVKTGSEYLDTYNQKHRRLQEIASDYRQRSSRLGEIVKDALGKENS